MYRLTFRCRRRSDLFSQGPIRPSLSTDVRVELTSAALAGLGNYLGLWLGSESKSEAGFGEDSASEG